MSRFWHDWKAAIITVVALATLAGVWVTVDQVHGDGGHGDREVCEYVTALGGGDDC